jgi:hypothetical protein
VPENATSPFHDVVLCDYVVRVQGNVHHYTLQCVLDNQTTVALLTGLAVGFSLLLVLNVASLVQYLAGSVCACVCGPVDASLRAAGLEPAAAEARSFGSTLGSDGALLLQLVTEVSSDAVAADMLAAAYLAMQGEGGAQTPQGPQQGGHTDIPMGVVSPSAPQPPPMYPPLEKQGF